MLTQIYISVNASGEIFIFKFIGRRGRGRTRRPRSDIGGKIYSAPTAISTACSPKGTSLRAST